LSRTDEGRDGRAARGERPAERDDWRAAAGLAARALDGLGAGAGFGATVGIAVGSIVARHNALPTLGLAYGQLALLAGIAFAGAFGAVGLLAGLARPLVRVDPLPCAVGAGVALFGALSLNPILPGTEFQFPGIVVNPLLAGAGLGVAAILHGRGVAAAARRRGRLTLALSALVVALVTIACWTPVPREEREKPPGLFPGPTGRRVALLGVDGATWDVALPLVRAGRMPVLARLMAEGVHGPLATYAPTASPLLWTTMVTGKGHREHGITGFTARRAPLVRYGAMEVPGWTGLDKFFARFPTRIVESRDRRTNALWNILSEAGWSVGFANWWASFPAEIVKGYVVSDHFAFALGPYRERGFEYLTDTPGRVFPDSLVARLVPLSARPEDLSDADLARFFRAEPGDLAAVRAIADWEKPVEGATGATVQPNEFYLGAFLLPYLEDVSATRRTIVLEEEYEPDLLGFYVRGIDDIQHHFWHFREPGAFPEGSIPKEQLAKFGGLMESYYVFTDSLLGEVVRGLDSETTILVVSDHGQVASGRIPWSGTHFLDDPPPGIFVAVGPGIRRGETVAGASVYDIAPTILRALGFPAADDQTGRALDEIFTPEFAAAAPRRTIPSYDRYFHSWKMAALAAEGIDDLDEQMQERLRALGYVK